MGCFTMLQSNLVGYISQSAMVSETMVKYDIKVKQVLKYPKCLTKDEKKINTGIAVLRATFGKKYWLILI